MNCAQRLSVIVLATLTAFVFQLAAAAELPRLQRVGETTQLMVDGAPYVVLGGELHNFAGTLTDFKRADNPIFIPEAHFDAGNLFIALGQYSAIGFAPFGIEGGADDAMT